MIELGYPDFVVELFAALFAPAGTSNEIVQLLVGEVAKMVREPSVVARAARAGYEWIGAGPDAVRQKMAITAAQTQDVMNAFGIGKR